MAKQGPMAKHFVFTLNNYTEDEIKQLSETVPTHFHYICWGKEKGENETPHLQGYFNSIKKHRITAIKKIPGTYQIAPPRSRRASEEKPTVGYLSKKTEEEAAQRPTTGISVGVHGVHLCVT